MTDEHPMAVVVIPKPLTQSKAFWTNLAAFIAALVPVLVAAASSSFDEVEALKIATALGLVNAIVQLGIRYFGTAAPIAGSPQDTSHDGDVVD